MSEPKYLFGLIGRKLGHSFSQGYFTEKFRKLGLNAEYRNFEINNIFELKGILRDHPNLVGLNVTIPYKESLMHFMNDGASLHAPVMAANTLVIKAGKIVGIHNTDIYGFSESLRRFYPHPDGRALILGTGGAAKAVYAVLNEPVFFKSVEWVSRAPNDPVILSYEEVHARGLQDYDLIVNTTPLGMYPEVETAPDLPYDTLRPGQYLFDLVYNPAETRFLSLGKARGCEVKNGLEMLHLQAEKAWEIWQDSLHSS